MAGVVLDIGFRDQVGPAFVEGEYQLRQQRLRASMDAAGLASVVCTSPESLFYLCGYDANTAWSDQALVVHTDVDRPTLLIRDIDEPLTPGLVLGADIATYNYGTDAPERIIQALVGASAGGGRVGLEYWGSGAAVPYVRRLETALAGGKPLPDASLLISDLRVKKSPAELQYVMGAARVNDAALERAVETARPGITELQFAGEIEYALRRQNSEYPAMPTWMASGQRTACSHASPSERTLQPGDPIKCSFAAVKRRYHVTAYQSFYLGTPPARYRDVFSRCLDALDALIDRSGIGVPVADACRAAHTELDRHGLAQQNMGRWGYGVGIAYPPTWLEPLEITQQSPAIFDVGMVFCLHVSMSLPEEGFGFSVGANYMVTDDGMQRVNARPPEIIEIGLDG